MAKKATLDIRFPMAGEDRKFAFRAQPPFTTPKSQNMRPDGNVDDRERGGSRPGIIKAFYEQVDATKEVRLLSTVTVLKNDGLQFWIDDFDADTIQIPLQTAAFDGPVPKVLENKGATVDTSVEDAAAVRDAISLFDASQAYTIEMFIAPFKGEHHGIYKIFLRMDDTTPDLDDDGGSVELSLTGKTGIFDLVVRETISGTTSLIQHASGSTGQTEAGWLRVLVTGNNIKVTWLDTTILGIATFGAPKGKRLGFGIETTNIGGVTLVDAFQVHYFETAAPSEFLRRIPVASAGGKLFREDILGQLKQVTTTLTLNDDRLLLAAERTQILYIADYGEPKVTGTDGTIAAPANDDRLDAASVPDWTALGIDADDDLVAITDGQGGVVNGNYGISAIAAGFLTLDTNIGGGTCRYRILRGAKKYDPDADTLTMWTADTDKGFVPLGFRIILLYRDSIFLAASMVSPQLWHLSRQGNANDWDTGAASDDVGRAITGLLSDAGEIGEPILAALNNSDDYIIIGCENSTWIMRGDPRYGGQIDSLSKTIGCIDKGAMCLGPEGEIVFLSKDGLYIILAGGGAPVSLSRDRMPNRLRNINTTLNEVLCVYDVQERGVHIYVTPRNAGAIGSQHFWFDWGTRSFWSVKLQDDHQPFSILQYNSYGIYESAVLLGCRDGFVRKYYKNYEEDDGGKEIESFVLIGPIRTAGEDMRDGIVQELIGVIGEGSGDVKWTIFVGESMEQAVTKALDGTSFASGTWKTFDHGGLNFTERPMARGSAFVLKMENADDEAAWTFERVSAVVRRLGRVRLIG